MKNKRKPRFTVSSDESSEPVTDIIERDDTPDGYAVIITGAPPKEKLRYKKPGGDTQDGTRPKRTPKEQPSGARPKRTPEEQAFLDDMNWLRRQEGEPPMTVQEENLFIEEARMVGEL